jgi:bifunctional non-homologous end joining protein LigD
MAYYLNMARYVLPAIADRPLTYRPYPHGVEQRPDRYHQRVIHAVPEGVHVASLKGREKAYEPRFIGGSLMTLVYLVQLNVISFDAWLSRVMTPDTPDVAVLDLDPMPGVEFQQVTDVARWLHDELQSWRIPGFLKTSGSSGLHVYIPLASGTTFRESWQFCELLARLVTKKHPKHATIERTISQRGRRVYIDYLQNLPGKTLAAAYSVRANPFAGVSTPLRWPELKDNVRPEDFTIATIVERVKREGDLWIGLATAKGINLRAPADARAGDR